METITLELASDQNNFADFKDLVAEFFPSFVPLDGDLSSPSLVGTYSSRTPSSTRSITGIINISGIPPASTEQWPTKLASSWQLILEQMGTSIALICAAGGTRALISLLKAWVDERRGRTLRVKQGDSELEIQGGMSLSQIEQLVAIFEKTFGKSKIIKP